MNIVWRRLLGTALVMCLAGPAARAAEPIKIGFSIEQTGPFAVVGKTGLLAFKIWEDEVNAEGGLLGRPVKLVYYDDQSNPSLVPAIYTKLIDIDKVDLLISSYGTNLVARTTGCSSACSHWRPTTISIIGNTSRCCPSAPNR
jgi:branched-chain amino acid transport system substrate-binding protein